MNDAQTAPLSPRDRLAVIMAWAVQAQQAKDMALAAEGRVVEDMHWGAYDHAAAQMIRLLVDEGGAQMLAQTRAALASAEGL